MSPGFDAPPGSEHPVREPRVGKMFLARLHSARISDAEILVRNISEHGLGARCKGAIPAEGEEIASRWKPMALSKESSAG